MKRMIDIFLCIVVAIAVAPAAMAAERQAVSIGEKRTIYSTVLDEEREILVYLPPSYRAERAYARYPVFYFLDGEKFFHAFSGAVQQLSSDATPRMPEMIVVGIVGRNRIRDSSPTRSLRGYSGKPEKGYEVSGGSATFLKFVRQELIPFVDKEYRTDAYRIYGGYSFTGLSVLDALLSMPGTFNAYLAIDPSWWWDDYAMEKKGRAFLAQAGQPADGRQQVQLFVATNGEPYPARFFPRVKDAGALAAMFDRAQPRAIDWAHRHYADESHHSMPLRAVLDGLTHIFRGHAPGLEELYSGELAAIEGRYQALSRRLGTTIFLREDLMNFLGYQFLYQHGDIDRAIGYFKLNVKYYPESANGWDSLGEAYAVKGDKAAAIEAYRKVLGLDGGNANAKTKISELLR